MTLCGTTSSDVSAPSLHRSIGVLVLAACLLALAGTPAVAQPELVDDAFDSSYPESRLLTVWDQGSTTELCFVTNIPFDRDDFACTNGSSIEQVTSKNIWTPSEPTIFQGDVYFVADDPDYGVELFRYDGDAVDRVTDVNASGDSYPEQLTVFDDALYFRATGPKGQELYRYTGSTVELVQDLGPGSSDPGDFTLYNGDLYFTADVSGSTIELYRATGSGVRIVDRIRTDGNAANPKDLAAYKGLLYFSADPGNGNGRQLIAYNGSDYFPQFVSTPEGNGRDPQGLTVYDGDLYYSARTTDGRELFRFTDLLLTEEEQITHFESSGSDPSSVTGYNDTILFSATEPTEGTELYSLGVDERSGATRIDLFPGASSANPCDLTVHDGGLYFAATRGNADADKQVLHRYDGSTVSRVKRSNNLSASGSGVFAYKKVPFEGDLYFSAQSESAGTELHRSDGATVERVDDFVPGTDSFNPYGLIRYDGDLYFGGSTPSTGSELYRYDGTSIRLAADVASGGKSALPFQMTVFNGFLYFAATDSNDDRELYRYSPSTGAQRVENINASGSAFNPYQGYFTDFQVYDGSLYFAAFDGTSGFELHRTNGVSTERVADINGGSGSAYPSGLTVYDGRLYFSARNGSDGQQLYGYDASTDNVKQVGLVNPGGSSFRPNPEMQVFDDHLYFAAQNGSSGSELYRFDGFAISQVADLDSGSSGSSPTHFAVYNDRLYFTATTEESGREPYSYDGQSVQSAEIVPGPISGGGASPAVFDDGSGARLFVTATDNTSGIELYAFDADDAPLPVDLTAFEATTTAASDVRLSWTTASETANAGFAVQRDAGTTSDAWTKIGYVEGHGTTGQPHTYRFTDATIPYDADSLRYRLKQVDADGTTHLSDPVSVDLTTASGARLLAPYPNPAHSQTTVRFTVPTGAPDVRLELVDVLGRTVETLSMSARAGRHERTVPVSTLASGVYFLRLTVDGTSTTQKLTVVR